MTEEREKFDISQVEITCTNVPFRGTFVNLNHCDSATCKHEHLDVMHHIGNPDGKHYCPTGFIYCCECGGVGDEPEPYECHKWGED